MISVSCSYGFSYASNYGNSGDFSRMTVDETDEGYTLRAESKRTFTTATEALEAIGKVMALKKKPARKKSLAKALLKRKKAKGRGR